MRTALTDLLEIDHPVMCAGMGGVSYHELTAAVSEAGGIGCLGASTMSFERMLEEMARTAERTSKPWGVDLLTALPGDMERQVHAIVDAGAKLFVAGLGIPRDVIAQGTEAGGHTGTVATLALVPQVVDAVDGAVPVVAAGGIFDGRGLAAALALGAAGAWIGTRFIATPQAWGTPGYKDRLVEMTSDDTVISRAYSGKTCRVVRNAYTRHFEEHPDELQPFPQQLLVSMEQGANHLGAGPDTPVDPDREFWPAGQGVGAIDGLIDAGRLVVDIVTEADAVIGGLDSLR